MEAIKVDPNPEPPVEKRKPGRPKGSGPKIEAGTKDARQIAAAILEVLAGVRLPSDAAGAVGVSLARYYQLESRALDGLVKACEPRPVGRQLRPESEIAHLQEKVTDLEREVQRRQALLRASQRTIGLAEVSKDKVTDGKKRRKRRPTVRALRAVEVLRGDSAEAVVPLIEEPAPISP